MKSDWARAVQPIFFICDENAKSASNPAITVPGGAAVSARREMFEPPAGKTPPEMNQGYRRPSAGVPLALAQLSSPLGGPERPLFHRDGRHLSLSGLRFASAHSWSGRLARERVRRPRSMRESCGNELKGGL
jgi:hypothetical protein